MTETTVNAISAKVGAGDLVRHLCAQWPDAPGLEASFALCAAAAVLEELFAPAAGQPVQSEIAYKAAAMLAADIYALGRLGNANPTLRDVHALTARSTD
ncbi:MAG: hypothetical protein ACWA47_12695 [Brevirhabdus sp.]